MASLVAELKLAGQLMLGVAKSPTFWSFTALAVACAYVLAH